MRKTFSNIIEKRALADEKIIFITGDLGYAALENLRDKLKDRFINAGVAEQNMIGMAGGLAYKGYKVFCYSIAPFIVYRCLEQFRNDVCFHNLPVFIVGNGGGYGYGIMGSSHHAIEDIACLSGMPNNHCYVPSFVEDVDLSIDKILERNQPAYLRLGLGKPSPNPSKKFESFSSLASSNNSEITIISSGPVTNQILNAIKTFTHIDVFTCNEYPVVELSESIKQSLKKTQKLLVVEEHISTGGLGEQLSSKILSEGIPLKKYIPLFAKGYPNNLYGNQDYHLKQSGLDSENIQIVINSIL